VITQNDLRNSIGPSRCSSTRTSALNSKQIVAQLDSPRPCKRKHI
jgi:hypothetical protein